MSISMSHYPSTVSPSISICDALHQSRCQINIDEMKTGKWVMRSIFFFLSETIISDIVHISVCIPDLVYFRITESVFRINKDGAETF